MHRSRGESHWCARSSGAGCPLSARPKNSWGHRIMWEDPIVAEVHGTREKLAADYAFDIQAIFADLRQRQVALGPRLVRQKEQPNQTLQPTGDATSLFDSETSAEAAPDLTTNDSEAFDVCS